MINGYGDLLLRELAQDDPHREVIAEIRSVGQRAAGLTRQLLAFSRKQVLRPQPLIIDAVVHDMRQMISRLLGEDVELKMVLNAGEAVVFADPGQFDQVLMNLVVNARDAMPAGGTLTIETEALDEVEPGRTEDPARPWITIEVRDTGVGMDEAMQCHLFEPFFTTKDRGKGSGLGLSTIHGIVVQSGGHIQVESAAGAGTTFRIYLPKLAEPMLFAKGIEETPRLYGTETVLVVEDEAEVSRYSVAALKAYGYRVLTAENAQDALLVFEREEAGIDVVLTDVVMPGLSGRDLAERLAQLQPAIKVLFMSGYTSDIIAGHGILEHGLTLVEKPFSPEQLVQKVREVLGPPKSLSRVLVLADDEVRNLLDPLLNRSGYEVVEAASIEKFQEAEFANAPDLVIMELPTAEQQAIETVRALREQVPGVAIIAILEASGGHFLEMERSIAADAAIAKPISPEFLLRTVKEVLRKEGKL